MIINGIQIDETEVLDSNYEKGTVFRVSDLIDYVLNHPDEFLNKRHLSDKPSDRDTASGYKGSIKHPQRIVEWDDTGVKTSRR
ncbi:MAG: hypothetical protein KKD18_06115 [Nanoarchaeota archaeon]|nr:hypothetical protein [Nanoarchaeota archaeon]